MGIVGPSIEEEAFAGGVNQPPLASEDTFSPCILGSVMMGLLELAGGLCPHFLPLETRPAASWSPSRQQALISCCFEACGWRGPREGSAKHLPDVATATR